MAAAQRAVGNDQAQAGARAVNRADHHLVAHVIRGVEEPVPARRPQVPPVVGIVHRPVERVGQAVPVAVQRAVKLDDPRPGGADVVVAVPAPVRLHHHPVVVAGVRAAIGLASAPVGVAQRLAAGPSVGAFTGHVVEPDPQRRRSHQVRPHPLVLVRVVNRDQVAAQALGQRFGFAPAQVRRGHPIGVPVIGGESVGRRVHAAGPQGLAHTHPEGTEGRVVGRARHRQPAHTHHPWRHRVRDVDVQKVLPVEPRPAVGRRSGRHHFNEPVQPVGRRIILPPPRHPAARLHIDPIIAGLGARVAVLPVRVGDRFPAGPDKGAFIRDIVEPDPETPQPGKGLINPVALRLVVERDQMPAQGHRVALHLRPAPLPVAQRQRRIQAPPMGHPTAHQRVVVAVGRHHRPETTAPHIALVDQQIPVLRHHADQRNEAPVGRHPHAQLNHVARIEQPQGIQILVEVRTLRPHHQPRRHPQPMTPRLHQTHHVRSSAPIVRIPGV